VSFKGFPNVPDNPGPTQLENFRQFLIQLAAASNRHNRGKMNFAVDQSGDGTLTVTLTANVASTTVTDERLSYYSAVVFDPMTANAAAELAAGTLYVTQTNRGTGSWVLTHANNAQTDRTYRMAIIG
jgi:hypothetical protein